MRYLLLALICVTISFLNCIWHQSELFEIIYCIWNGTYYIYNAFGHYFVYVSKICTVRIYYVWVAYF